MLRIPLEPGSACLAQIETIGPEHEQFSLGKTIQQPHCEPPCQVIVTKSRMAQGGIMPDPLNRRAYPIGQAFDDLGDLSRCQPVEAMPPLPLDGQQSAVDQLGKVRACRLRRSACQKRQFACGPRRPVTQDHEYGRSDRVADQSAQFGQRGRGNDFLRRN